MQDGWKLYRKRCANPSHESKKIPGDHRKIKLVPTMIQPAPFSSQQCSKRFNEINFYNKKPCHAVNHNQLCSLEYTDIFMPLIYIPLIYILLDLWILWFFWSEPFWCTWSKYYAKVIRARIFVNFSSDNQIFENCLYGGNQNPCSQRGWIYKSEPDVPLKYSCM